MLDDRKAAILRAVVEKYIETAQPVGSNHVATTPGVNVSSATVRNDMATLEQEGYLVQPHTSAGRIPTDKGYRFFVDSLGRGRLDPRAAQQVRSFFSGAHGALEEMLVDTSRLLANLTNYAAVVVRPPADVATVRSVQVVGLSAHVVMVVVVMSNGAIEKTTIEVTDEIGAERLAAASAHMSRFLIGCTLADLASVPDAGDGGLDRLVADARQALVDELSRDEDHVYVGGAARMASSFDAVDTVRRVLDALEHQFLVVGLIRDVLDRGLSIAIGTEHGVEPLAACSVVVAPYAVDGETVGTIGVLGPTRMNYPQALAAVEIVSERLGRRLSEG
ncbi:MAG: heat-inducible transcriptional repressor HrcA [Acidimicrobiia bacterium]